MLPPGFSIRSPPFDSTVSFVENLPFYRFAASIHWESLPLGTNTPNSPSTIDSRILGPGELNTVGNPAALVETVENSGISSSHLNKVTDSSTFNVRIKAAFDAALRSIVPEVLFDGGSTSTLHRLILFPLANNFAGLGNFPAGELLAFVESEITERAYRSIRLSPSYTSRAIAQSIFKVVIEAGNERVVEALLRENQAVININQVFLGLDGTHWTPIERASALKNRELTHCLLRYGIDFDQITLRRDSAAYLLATIYRFCKEQNAETAVTQGFLVLLDRCGDIDHDFFPFVLASVDGDLTCLFLSYHIDKKRVKWRRQGIFLDIIEQVDPHLLSHTIQIMVQAGIDLNHEYGPRSRGGTNHTLTILGEAVQRGNVETTRTLLNARADVYLNHQ